MPGEPQMYALQARIGHTRAALEIRPAIVALGRNRGAAEDRFVELSEPPPIQRDDVGVAETRSPCLRHRTDSRRRDAGSPEWGVRTAAVILAAGAGTRFGSPKQLARVGDRTMLEHVAEIARASGLDPILVVLPTGIPAPSGAAAVTNDRADEGISRSLRLGIEALPDDVEAAVVLLGDQPTVSASWVAALLTYAGGRPVVAVRAEGRIGPPVLLRRDAFYLVGEATGDVGLAPVLARHPELVSHVDVPAHAPDVDTPEDLAPLRRPSEAGPGG